MRKRHDTIRTGLLSAGLILLMFLSGCGQEEDSEAEASTTQTQTQEDSESAQEEDTSSSSAGTDFTYLTAEYKSKDTDATYDISSACVITLDGDSAEISGNGAAADGSIITITENGTYVISGTLTDGQIIVDAGDEDDVRLVLNGVSITSSDSAPIYVENADKTVLILADGSENYISDASKYIDSNESEDEPNAAIFSKDDLSITGSGSLAVEGNYKDGIASKNDLKITGGTITVTAVEDGIRGRDSVSINGGSFDITAGLDGLKSNNDSESDQGYIILDGGSFRIVSGNDGIQAETALQINGGSFDLVCGSGSDASADASESQKGLKAGSSLIVTGGTFVLDCADDAVHTSGSILIDGGSFTIDTGDDAFHADSDLTIEDGEILIASSFEGLEGAAVTVNGGTIRLTASDDGMNAAGGTDTNMPGGRPGMDSFFGSNEYQITINGGYLVIDASGDGIDSNGDLTITGGTVLINGPVSSGDGSLDYGGSCTISGGILVAAGSAGMTQTLGTSSSQCSLLITFSFVQQAGTLLHIADEDGTPLLSFAPLKTYQSVIISLPEFTEDAVYTLYTGGTADLNEDGYERSESSTDGTQTAEITLTGSLTSVDETGKTASGGFGNFGGSGGGFDGGRGGDGKRGGRLNEAAPDGSF